MIGLYQPFTDYLRCTSQALSAEIQQTLIFLSLLWKKKMEVAWRDTDVKQPERQVLAVEYPGL